jgi:hypothetical protein
MKHLLTSLSLLLILLTCGPARAWQDWTTTDQNLFIASSVAITADWATTRWAARNNWPNNTHENNPILGRRPTVSTVDSYFVFLLISNYAIAQAVPQEYRGMYLTFRTVTHGSAVQGNVELGWRVKF